jgi:DNA polymerase-1
VVQWEALDKVKREEFKVTNGNVGYEITKSAMPFFIEASKQGMLIDDELRVRMKEVHLDRANELEDALSATLGYTINCRSSQQVIKLVHDQILPMYGIKRTKRTSKQEYLMDIAGSTSNEAVRLILGSIIRVRQNRNIVSRYLHDGIVDADGRVRTNWNLAGTRSGRFSSSKPWWPGLALQTTPEDARVIFIPDPGYVFIGFDYRQAEAVVVAVLTYNHDLLDAMAAGEDIHTQLAAQLPFGKTYEELLAEIAVHVANGKSKDECRPRFISKKSRHAFNYVEGADTFTLHVNREWIDTGIGITRTEGREIRKMYLELNPGLEPWWDQVRSTIRTQKYMDNSFGRRRWVLGRITEEVVREMVSYYPQSTIGDLCTQAIVKVCRALPNAQVMAHMHDGGLFQVPIAELDESYETMMDLVEWPIRVEKEYITIPADGKVGYNWGEMGKHGAS